MIAGNNNTQDIHNHEYTNSDPQKVKSYVPKEQDDRYPPDNLFIIQQKM